MMTEQRLQEIESYANVPDVLLARGELVAEVRTLSSLFAGEMKVHREEQKKRLAELIAVKTENLRLMEQGMADAAEVLRLRRIIEASMGGPVSTLNALAREALASARLDGETFAGEEATCLLPADIVSKTYTFEELRRKRSEAPSTNWPDVP